MYAGRVAGCSLVSHVEYADGTDRRTDARPHTLSALDAARERMRNCTSCLCRDISSLKCDVFNHHYARFNAAVQVNLHGQPMLTYSDCIVYIFPFLFLFLFLLPFFDGEIKLYIIPSVNSFSICPRRELLGSRGTDVIPVTQQQIV